MAALSENIEKFVAEFEKSLADATFVKLTLSNYKGAERQLQRISARPIDTKKGGRVMFQQRFETRDVVKNHTNDEAVEELRRQLTSGFRNGHLFTTSGDHQLEIGKRNSRLISGKPSFAAPATRAHDRQKTSLIDPNAFYLKALGIAGEDGQIKSKQQDKWRQINKFVEVLAGLIDNSPIRDKQTLRVVDMGSGKGYLTFAAYDYLANVRSAARRRSAPGTSDPSTPSVQMTGVEARKELVDLCNGIAQAGGFNGLRFVQGKIADFDPGDGLDILIALHACDTATDDALYKGLSTQASIIVAAPCCHKEVRKQIRPPAPLDAILKHGVMLERTAETITDGLRALLLEANGYKTKVFEFVPTEHTPKNNMLVGTKATGRNKDNDAAAQADEIMQSFGVRRQHLNDLIHGK